MKKHTYRLIVVTLLPSALFLSACSSVKRETTITETPSGSTMVEIATEDGVPGGTFVNTSESNLKVVSIDKESRKVTLLGEGGIPFTPNIRPDVDLSDVEAGDRVKMAVTQRMVVSMVDVPSVDDGMPANEDVEIGKPGMVIADVSKMIVIVTAIDMKSRTATLQLEDGTIKTVPVRSGVDLTRRKVGEKIMVEIVEEISVEVVDS